MSKNINVNPDHYKLAGRERQGENIVQTVERQAYAAERADAERWQARQRQRPASPGETPPAASAVAPKKTPARPPARSRRKPGPTQARARAAKARPAPKKRTAKKPGR